MSQSEQRGIRARDAAARELRTLIERAGLTITAVSAATGIPRPTLHKKLNGSVDLTVVELVKLAIALDVPAADLVTVAAEAAGVEDDDRRTEDE